MVGLWEVYVVMCECVIDLMVVRLDNESIVGVMG